MSADFRNKVAVVTGSTRGIGRAIAESLAGLGAEVIITARRDGDVVRVVEEMTAAGHKARGTRCDTRSYEDCQSLMSFSAQGSDGFDILINNAGIGIFGHISEVSPDQWDQVIDTNLSGVFYCCHAALPYLKKRGGGHIINLSSLAGKNAFKGGTLYNASKFGLEGLSESLMLDLRYDNIKVSTVMPGSVATKFSGREPSEKDSWKLTSEDVAEIVVDLLAQEHRALASRVELRPFQPKK
jgi:NAD(P)-dependent dehydrogenase (short-subunit alcohol dehydrogenase family)